MPDRPVIGLSTYREEARWGVWDTTADLLPATYARSVEAAGAVAVLLPPQIDGAESVVSRLDGLIIAGGADVDPARYGAEPHPLTRSWRGDRDAWEVALLEAAAAAGTPVMGICRGMQLMAVTPAAPWSSTYRTGWATTSTRPPATRSAGCRSPPSRGRWSASWVGERLQVNCHHHQAVADHPGYEVTARAADGTVEAIEDPERPFWLAVQWHPEFGDDHGLFRGLVAAAGSR